MPDLVLAGCTSRVLSLDTAGGSATSMSTPPCSRLKESGIRMQRSFILASASSTSTSEEEQLPGKWGVLTGSAGARRRSEELSSALSGEELPVHMAASKLPPPPPSSKVPLLSPLSRVSP
eukprot:767251-Hanusia_phi.AAC.3